MPEASELVAAADTLSEASLYKEAISTYTKAIELAPTSPSYYIKRYPPRYQLIESSSTAYQRSGQLEAALKVSCYSGIELILGCGTGRRSRSAKSKGRPHRGSAN